MTLGEGDKVPDGEDVPEGKAVSVRVKEEERLPTLPPLPPYTSEGEEEEV